LGTIGSGIAMLLLDIKQPKAIYGSLVTCYFTNWTAFSGLFFELLGNKI
jgi:hypothetical protein